jgi:hypothetical protein
MDILDVPEQEDFFTTFTLAKSLKTGDLTSKLK